MFRDIKDIPWYLDYVAKELFANAYAKDVYHKNIGFIIVLLGGSSLFSSLAASYKIISLCDRRYQVACFCVSIPICFAAFCVLQYMMLYAVFGS